MQDSVAQNSWWKIFIQKRWHLSFAGEGIITMTTTKTNRMTDYMHLQQVTKKKDVVARSIWKQSMFTFVQWVTDDESVYQKRATPVDVCWFCSLSEMDTLTQHWHGSCSICHFPSYVRSLTSSSYVSKCSSKAPHIKVTERQKTKRQCTGTKDNQPFHQMLTDF